MINYNKMSGWGELYLRFVILSLFIIIKFLLYVVVV